MKTDNFMNDKKSHEVQLMSDLVDGIAKYYGLNQVRIFITLSLVGRISFKGLDVLEEMLLPVGEDDNIKLDFFLDLLFFVCFFIFFI